MGGGLGWSEIPPQMGRGRGRVAEVVGECGRGVGGGADDAGTEGVVRCGGYDGLGGGILEDLVGGGAGRTLRRARPRDGCSAKRFVGLKANN